MSETSSIRRAVQALSSKPCCRRYPPELRVRIAAHVRRELATGKTLWRQAQQLDMGSGTLQRFLAEERPASLVPVRVVDVDTRPGLVSSVVVRGGHGVTVEGLSVEDVATLLRALA